MAASSLLPCEGWESVFEEETMAFDALAIFPAEIWEMIFNPLNDPKDLIRCRRVCMAWKRILKRQKPVYMFALALPHLFRYLRKNDLLACCKVSSSWQIAVDDLMKFLIETGKPHRIGLGFHKTYLERFLTRIQPSAPVNLAVYRNLYFECQGLISDPNVMRYLDRFGRLVINLTVYVDKHRVLDVVRDTLYFTTNVRALRVSAWTYYNCYADEEPRRTLDRFPLPDRPYLTHLNYNSSLLLPFNWLLLKYGAQLEKLEVECLDLDLEKIDPHKGMKLSCLKELSLTQKHNNHIKKWRLIFQTLNVQLTHLTVENWHWPMFNATIAPDIVEFINHFQYTLEELNLDYHFRECKVETLEGLKLPQLKTMSIKDVGLPTPESILSMTPKLSKLYLEFRGESDKEFYKNLYDEPGFWEMLPSLQFVYVKWYSNRSYIHFYTREKYLQAEKKKKEIRLVFASVCMVLLHSPVIGKLIDEK